MYDQKTQSPSQARPSRIRPIVATVAGFGLILALLFSVWAMIGIRSMRQALVAETERQSLALLQSLILASQYSLSTGALVERLEREALVERARALLEAEKPQAIKPPYLSALATSLDIDGLTLWFSDSAVSFPADLPTEIDLEAELDPTNWSGREDAVPLSFTDSVSGRFWQGVGFVTNLGPAIVWRAPETKGSPPAIGGVGELIQEIGRQSGVNYIMLQAPDGIVFASRPLKPVLKLAADSFLVDILENDVPATREIIFEGIPVLEAAAPFLSTDLPSGMFRVGLSLNAVDDAVGRLTLQLGLTALLLVLLSTTVSAIVITRRSLAELGQSYREVETLTGRVLDSIDQAVIAVDAEGRITIFNPTAERWFGRSSNDVRGSRIGSVLPLDFGLEDVRLRHETIAGREVAIRSAQGDRVLVHSTTPLITSDSTQVGAVAVIRDESDARALALQMRRAERLSAMGQLAAGVAHEIRNPLNAIALASQQLKLELAGAEGADFADTIWAESKRLNLIVEDFLSLARPSSQRKSPVDWTELITSVAQMARLEAERNEVSLHLLVEPSCMVSGVADELRKALWNLLRNALEATPVGGSISITLTTAAGMSSLTIDDTGSGIAPEALARVFEPWFTTKSGGTGLGLAITHRIVLDHEGTIEIVSPVPGRPEGTRATVRLPVV